MKKLLLIVLALSLTGCTQKIKTFTFEIKCWDRKTNQVVYDGELSDSIGAAVSNSGTPFVLFHTPNGDKVVIPINDKACVAAGKSVDLE